MKRSITLSSILAVAMLAGAAEASDRQWYASGQAGVRAVEQQSIEAPGVAISLEQHNGVFASFAVGRFFDTDGVGFRGELEASYRDGGRINRFSVNTAPAAVSGNSLSSWSVMANGMIDFNNRSRFTPYIGAGVGVVMIDGDIQSPGNSISDSSSTFGVQGIAGVDVRISDSVSAFTDFRYQKAIDAELTLIGSAGNGIVDVEYDAYTFGAGIRVRF